MASFRLFSVFSYINTNIQHMWKIIRSLDSNIRPLEFESPPITSRPGHPLYSFTLQITCESFRIKTQLSAKVEVSALQKPLSLSLTASFRKGECLSVNKTRLSKKNIKYNIFFTRNYFDESLWQGGMLFVVHWLAYDWSRVRFPISLIDLCNFVEMTKSN